MKEIILVNELKTECSAVATGIDTISFTVEAGNLSELHEQFKNVTSLNVSGEDEVVYGMYENLTFASILADAEGNVTVTMKIASEIEQRLSEMESENLDRDAAIMELAELASESEV